VRLSLGLPVRVAPERRPEAARRVSALNRSGLGTCFGLGPGILGVELHEGLVFVTHAFLDEDASTSIAEKSPPMCPAPA
jgi:hypothetical protein